MGKTTEWWTFPPCPEMWRGPTVRCCEVDGHGEIELCPGGRSSTSVSFKTEMLGMWQHLQMGAHLQMSRLRNSSPAVPYKQQGRGSTLCSPKIQSAIQCCHIQVMILCWCSKPLHFHAKDFVSVSLRVLITTYILGVITIHFGGYRYEHIHPECTDVPNLLSKYVKCRPF